MKTWLRYSYMHSRAGRKRIVATGETSDYIKSPDGIVHKRAQWRAIYLRNFRDDIRDFDFLINKYTDIGWILKIEIHPSVYVFYTSTKTMTYAKRKNSRVIIDLRVDLEIPSPPVEGYKSYPYEELFPHHFPDSKEHDLYLEMLADESRASAE